MVERLRLNSQFRHESVSPFWLCASRSVVQRRLEFVAL